MVLSVLYVWCQLNKDQIVSFWFGTQFKVSPILYYDGMLLQLSPFYKTTPTKCTRTI
jgi:hypothetical protein